MSIICTEFVGLVTPPPPSNTNVEDGGSVLELQSAVSFFGKNPRPVGVGHELSIGHFFLEENASSSFISLDNEDAIPFMVDGLRSFRWRENNDPSMWALLSHGPSVRGFDVNDRDLNSSWPVLPQKSVVHVKTWIFPFPTEAIVKTWIFPFPTEAISRRFQFARLVRSF